MIGTDMPAFHTPSRSDKPLPRPPANVNDPCLSSSSTDGLEMATKKRISDDEAKQQLLTWPRRPRTWFPDGQRWLRAQPVDGRSTAPRLNRPGVRDFTAWTQPDGLWISLANDTTQPVSAALLVVEVCGTWQNLADKRSRYSPSNSALLVHLSAAWLSERVRVQHGAMPQRWTLLDAFEEQPTADLRLPVRSLRVLYSLPNDVHPRKRDSMMYCQAKDSLALEAHEFIAPHSALGSTNPQLRELVGRMLTPHCIV